MGYYGYDGYNQVIIYDYDDDSPFIVKDVQTLTIRTFTMNIQKRTPGWFW